MFSLILRPIDRSLYAWRAPQNYHAPHQCKLFILVFVARWRRGHIFYFRTFPAAAAVGWVCFFVVYMWRVSVWLCVAEQAGQCKHPIIICLRQNIKEKFWRAGGEGVARPRLFMHTSTWWDSGIQLKLLRDIFVAFMKRIMCLPYAMCVFREFRCLFAYYCIVLNDRVIRW